MNASAEIVSGCGAASEDRRILLTLTLLNKSVNRGKLTVEDWRQSGWQRDNVNRLFRAIRRCVLEFPSDG